MKDGATQAQVFYLEGARRGLPGRPDRADVPALLPAHRSLPRTCSATSSEISPEQLKALHGQGYRGGDTIGQTGIESYYDKYLRGTAGVSQLRVDSLGRPISLVLPKVPAHPGDAVRLTLDVKLQKAAEEALRYGIDRARNSELLRLLELKRAAPSSRIDPHDGSIRALASYPTYPPSLYVGRVRQRALDAAGLTPRTAEAMNFPALDRAINAAYPPGSTFKPVTAIAAMQEHILQPFEPLACTGLVREERHDLQELGSVRERGDDSADGARQIVRHLLLPSRLSLLRDAVRPRAAPAGVGEPVRLRPEDRNRPGLPSAAACCRRRTGGRRPTRRRPTRVTGQIDSLWKPGDSIQLAIGQKDLLVTPMQMARFYAMIANGGKLVTPHLLLDVEQPSSNGTPGRACPTPPPPAPEPTNVDAQALAVVRDGLYQATHCHARHVHLDLRQLSDLDLRQDRHGGEERSIPGDGIPRIFNQSWWCGYGPSDSPDLVVCALIENGGHGGDAAAPAALKVFESFFGKQATQTGPIHSD